MDARAVLAERTRAMHEAVARELIRSSFQQKPGECRVLVMFDTSRSGVQLPREITDLGRFVTVELGALYGSFSFDDALDVELSFGQEFRRVRIPFASMSRIEIPDQSFLLDMPLVPPPQEERVDTDSKVISLSGHRSARSARGG